VSYILYGAHCVMEASATNCLLVVSALNMKRHGCNRRCCPPTRSAVTPSRPQDRVTCPRVEKAKPMPIRFPADRHRSPVARLATTLLLLCPLAVAAQQAPPADLAPAITPGATTKEISRSTVASPSSTQLDDVISEGQQLEDEGRWVEALSHYDEHVREYPEAQHLRTRRTLAHIHVDIDRRMADSSYSQFVTMTPESQAMSMYQEICLKVNSHYVHAPNWLRIAWRGTASLDVAVTKPAFQNQFLKGRTSEEISAFRNLLRSDVNKRSVRTRSEARDLVNYTARLANQRLGIPLTTTVGEYCAGAISSLDQYSAYLTSAQLDDVYSQIEGNFIGLGIELKSVEDSLLIVKVIAGGPAQRAGVKAGDRILAVEGKPTDTISTEKAADLLKGMQGTYANVSIGTPGVAPRTIRIRRERVDVPCVEDVGIIDQRNGIGYFRLTSFQKTTSRDVDEALWKLHRLGMKSLIIDVRGNPGGLLTASVEVADKFVSDGTLVSTNGRSERENYNYKAHRVGTWGVPLIVLIDRDTASASEIFAGAIFDHGRGTVLGERSYGKGSVQGIFPLSISPSGVRLTTAKFYSPSGRPISERGVTPHRTVHMVAKPDAEDLAQTGLPTEQSDAVVAAACETARQLTIAKRQ